MPFNTPQGGFSVPGTEVAQAPPTLYPCNDRLVSLCPSTNDIWGHQFRCSPPSFQKKNLSNAIMLVMLVNDTLSDAYSRENMMGLKNMHNAYDSPFYNFVNNFYTK